MDNYSEIILKIESLNSRNIDDFFYFSVDLQKIISDKRSNIEKEILELNNLIQLEYSDNLEDNNRIEKSKKLIESSISKKKSIEVVMNIYNNRCREFNDNFYNNDELFRRFLKNYIIEQKKIFHSTSEKDIVMLYWPKFAEPFLTKKNDFQEIY